MTVGRVRMIVFGILMLTAGGLSAQSQFIPRRQDRPPGPALSPQQAIAKMTVPEGFSVELVAAEPDIVNPVAMTFDERGRVWIAESLEYPRRSAGKGRDRIKVLEDTNGDGTMDKVTIFAEGLNIPSGLAVGFGGVWVANAPDILFLRDTDGDGKADSREVVVTGFGRRDTHELPNSLTWGPDGWLYGLNGVFNHSRVRYPPSSPHAAGGNREFRFTVAMFRINPRTREFQVFAEGTSNPWGIAWDNEGSAFISACVIDHLWHITETGYYRRQAGAYPPHSWRIESIVKHKHQKAAYCGIEFFDSEAYPAKYRERLYMGNIHGGCINVDVLERDGSTYFARPAADFLTANDAWFMPVVQKTGPDGCLYILDWYDRYHCYQDANRDPNGVDRLRGRLYRIRYQKTPRVAGFDLATESDAQLIKRLHSPNIYFRKTAQRILQERNSAAATPMLQKVVFDTRAPKKTRMHALWSLVGTDSLDTSFHLKLLSDSDTSLRAWGVRAAGNAARVNSAVKKRIVELAHQPAPDVQLQVAIAARKIEGIEPVPVLFAVLSNAGNDKLLPHIVWQNLHPLLEDHSRQFISLVKRARLKNHPALAHLLPRVVQRMLATRNGNLKSAADLIAMLAEGPNAYAVAAGQCFDIVSAQIQSRELSGPRLTELKTHLEPVIHRIMSGANDKHPFFNAAILAAAWKDPAGLRVATSALVNAKNPPGQRLVALYALVAAEDDSLIDTVRAILKNRKRNSARFRGRVIAALGRLDDPRIADILLAEFQNLEPHLKPRAVELLTQRTVWAKRLLEAIGDKRIAPGVLNLNQARRLLASPDKQLAERVRATWGTIRETRDPARDKIIAEMKQFLHTNTGDPFRGEKVFQKVCAQCHKIYGKGVDVGPDITRNGRNSFDQLLSNVFDPSLVIGASYRARTVATTRGRLLTGLVVEENDQRIVLKVQGGKQEIIARKDIDMMKVSEISMMPEQLEKQLKPDEIADLFAYLSLDKPPGDPTARQLPGTRPFKRRRLNK